MKLDLNLISVLEAIMLERNVTRAATLLSMSQPAVSNALRRARQITNDDLFVKIATGVRPTSRMMAMWPEMQRSFDAIRALVAPGHFDAKTDTSTFRVAVTDSLAAEAVESIALSLRERAPRARLTFFFHTNATSVKGIEGGTLDCAVGMFSALPRNVHVQGLLTDRWVCVLNRGHKLARRMTFDDFLAAEHVLPAPSSQELGAIDVWLSLRGQSRNIVSVVNHFADAMRIAAGGDLLTCVPEKFFKRHKARMPGCQKLIAKSLPFETEKILYKLAWHDRLHAHPSHRFFRKLVAECCGLAPPRA